MRHQRVGKKLNMDTNRRKSLFKNLTVSLVEKGRITTTEAKAKALKSLIDKLVTKAKVGTLSSKRDLLAFFGRKSPVDKLETVIAPAFKERNSGFTRIIKKGERLGDGAKEAVMEWVEKIEVALVVPEKEKKEQLEEQKQSKKRK